MTFSRPGNSIISMPNLLRNCFCAASKTRLNEPRPLFPRTIQLAMVHFIFMRWTQLTLFRNTSPLDRQTLEFASQGVSHEFLDHLILGIWFGPVDIHLLGVIRFLVALVVGNGGSGSTTLGLGWSFVFLVGFFVRLDSLRQCGTAGGLWKGDELRWDVFVEALLRLI